MDGPAGAHLVVEVGAARPRSSGSILRRPRWGGTVAIIGGLTGYGGELEPYAFDSRGENISSGISNRQPAR